jgi:hypothetical protein
MDDIHKAAWASEQASSDANAVPTPQGKPLQPGNPSGQPLQSSQPQEQPPQPDTDQQKTDSPQPLCNQEIAEGIFANALDQLFANKVEKPNRATGGAVLDCSGNSNITMPLTSATVSSADLLGAALPLALGAVSPGAGTAKSSQCQERTPKKRGRRCCPAW